MAACTLHHDAYCVAYLHICRYNSKAVNGVLVGSVDGDSVIAVKAFPLSMLRVRLGSHPCSKQHSCWCAASALPPRAAAAAPNVTLSAHRSTRTARTRTAHCRILPGERARRRHGARAARQEDRRAHPLQVPRGRLPLYQGRVAPRHRTTCVWSLGPDGKRTGPTPTLPDAPKTLPVLEGYLDSSVHHKLVDFDVHLDDASRDWLNTALLA